MTIDCKGSEIKYFAGYICIPVPAEQQGEVIADRTYTTTIKIKAKTKKRSSTANSYMWVLCKKLADSLSTDGGERYSEIDIYRQHVKVLAPFTDYPPMTEREAKGLRYAWSSLGIGWLTDIVDYDAAGEKVIVRCYVGSSRFSARRMALLIDGLVQDCRALGIETRPQEEIDSLLRQWEESKEKGG